MQRLEDAKGQLSICEKALIEFMDGKRRAFPRFYFISPNDLLDILSNGNSPAKLQHHLSKVHTILAFFVSSAISILEITVILLYYNLVFHYCNDIKI